MKFNSFAICPSCIHVKKCVLTTQKEQVYSCSEYDFASTSNNNLPFEKANNSNENFINF